MKQIRILTVDDEKNIRLTMETCLQMAGYMVDTAENGGEALEKVHMSKYDLIFLDIKMPGMDGIEVLRHIKTVHSSIHVVMMTAYGTVENAVIAMKLGAVDYLQKPFTPIEVKETADLIAKRLALLSEEVEGDYPAMVEYAKGLLVKKEFNEARVWLQKAVALDMARPEAFNLLGVLYELENELLLAQKMYRTALSVDPSYSPATENLHRTVEWHYSNDGWNLGVEMNMKNRL